MTALLRTGYCPEHAESRSVCGCIGEANPAPRAPVGGSVSRWVWARRDTRWDVLPQEQPLVLLRVEQVGPRLARMFHADGGAACVGYIIVRDAGTVTITGPSPSLWTTSLPYRIAVEPHVDPDRHVYFSLEAHAVAYLDRNAHLARELELSPRMALSPRDEHEADEPRVEMGRAPSAGQVAMADVYGSSCGEE